MKNSLVTSKIPQVQGIVDVVGIAAMNAAKVQAEKQTVAGNQRVLAHGDKLAFELTAFIIAKMTELAEQIVGYLKLISGDTEIVIGETDGTGMIAGASNVFPGGIDSDFVNYGTNVKGKSTKKTKAQVFEMVKDGTFAQIFGGFGENLDRLCWEQDQIKLFVKDHAKWLHTDGYGTFFLFKVKGEFFVSSVDRSEGGLGVGARRLSRGHVWLAVGRHRIVVPQL